MTNILITGNLTYLAEELSVEFLREKNRIVLVSKTIPNISISKQKKIITHAVDPVDEEFAEILSAYDFDVIIYLPTHEEHIITNNVSLSEAGQLLSGLSNVLELSKNEKVQRFIYISSTEVYGKLNKSDEETQPNPESLNGYNQKRAFPRSLLRKKQ